MATTYEYVQLKQEIRKTVVEGVQVIATPEIEAEFARGAKAAGLGADEAGRYDLAETLNVLGSVGFRVVFGRDGEPTQQAYRERMFLLERSSSDKPADAPVLA